MFDPFDLFDKLTNKDKTPVPQDAAIDAIGHSLQQKLPGEGWIYDSEKLELVNVIEDFTVKISFTPAEENVEGRSVRITAECQIWSGLMGDGINESTRIGGYRYPSLSHHKQWDITYGEEVMNVIENLASQVVVTAGSLVVGLQKDPFVMMGRLAKNSFVNPETKWRQPLSVPFAFQYLGRDAGVSAAKNYYEIMYRRVNKEDLIPHIRDYQAGNPARGYVSGNEELKFCLDNDLLEESVITAVDSKPVLTTLLRLGKSRRPASAEIGTTKPDESEGEGSQ